MYIFFILCHHKQIFLCHHKNIFLSPKNIFRSLQICYVTTSSMWPKFFYATTTFLCHHKRYFYVTTIFVCHHNIFKSPRFFMSQKYFYVTTKICRMKTQDILSVGRQPWNIRTSHNKGICFFSSKCFFFRNFCIFYPHIVNITIFAILHKNVQKLLHLLFTFVISLSAEEHLESWQAVRAVWSF